MRFKSVLAAALCFFMPLAVSAAEPSENTDYRTMPQPLFLDGGKGKLQVLELFWYGCPHCYHMEGAIQAWLKKKPADVTFVRVPAVFQREKQDKDGKKSLHPWFIHAKAFYAAEVLGVSEKIHTPLFHALHEEKKKVYSEDELAAFFAGFGVPEKDFKAALNSFAVEAKAARAMEITARAGITGVPALIVNGKYQVLGERASTYDDYMAIVDHLLARDRGKR